MSRMIIEDKPFVYSKAFLDEWKLREFCVKQIFDTIKAGPDFVGAITLSEKENRTDIIAMFIKVAKFHRVPLLISDDINSFRVFYISIKE